VRLLDAKTSIIPFCISNRRNFELLSRSGVTSPTAPQELQLFCKDSVSCWNASRETKILLLALRYSYPASFIDITLITTVNWGAEFYYKYSGDDSSGHFYYDMNWINGSLVSTNHRIKYDPINKVWYDGFGQGNTADSTRPNYLVGSTSGTTQPASANTTSLTNPAFVWGFNSTGSALFAFDNPYYEAPSTPTYPSTLDVGGGNWGTTTFTLQSTSTTDEILYWKTGDTAGTTAIYYKVSESKWYDGSSGGQPTAFSINDGTPSDPSAVVSAGDSVKLTAGSSGNYGSFTMFST